MLFRSSRSTSSASSGGRRKAEEHLRDETALLELLGANYALWLWEPGSQCVGYDEFNFRHGIDFSKHEDVSSNPLYDAIKDNWKLLNKVFPRNVTFKPPPRRE